MTSEFCAIGADEIQDIEILEGTVLAKLGAGIIGPVGFGVDEKTGKKTNMIGAVKHTDGRAYLAVLDGKLLHGWGVVS